MASPAAFSCPASSAAGVTGPSWRTISTAGDGLRLAVPGWTARATRSSSVAPVCQRIPIRTLAWSGSGSTVTSAIRVRSSRLRSLLLVAGACHSPGRSAASFSSSARPGSGGSASRAASSACSASARAASLASQRASRLRATSRFSGSTGAKSALGAVCLVTRAFDGELGGPADPLVPAGHLVGCGERQGDLLGGQRVQQHARRPRHRRWRRRPTGRRAWSAGRRGRSTHRRAAGSVW